MDSLFLFQFACFIFMLVNAFFVALSYLHVRWENKRYERSRWMIVVAFLGLAIQYVIQMGFGFRAADDSLGAVVNILVYTPCFSLISMQGGRIKMRSPPKVLTGNFRPSQLSFFLS
nr:hypothetical protein [Prevotella sp.]